MERTFFEQTKCDRCGSELTVRIMSWFTKETICMECSSKENRIKKALRVQGHTDALEGCGFIPDV